MLRELFSLITTVEIIVDLFAGGGMSTAIEKAQGRHVDIAINHDVDAISMHKVNHPLPHLSRPTAGTWQPGRNRNSNSASSYWQRKHQQAAQCGLSLFKDAA